MPAVEYEQNRKRRKREAAMEIVGDSPEPRAHLSTSCASTSVQNTIAKQMTWVVSTIMVDLMKASEEEG